MPDIVSSESTQSDIVQQNSSKPTQLVYPLSHVDLTKSKYDQNTFIGRAKHFFETADPRTILATKRQLAEAAQLIKSHERGKSPPGTTEKDLWAAKVLYDSAFHPDTGEKMFLLGRMSFQVPGNMTITGLMLTFYKSNSAVIFWQFANQTFNAIVNYTNRSGKETSTMRQILEPYVIATTAATVTALGLNMFVAKFMPLMIGRFVPFVAVAAANSLNIPLMRQRELEHGIPVYDKDGNSLGLSIEAAKKGITQVVLSRVVMAVPGMVFTPIIMNALEKKNFFQRIPWARAPLQVSMVGFCLVFATPLGCALFPQKSSIAVSHLEQGLKENVQQSFPDVTKVYFNKGL